MEPLHLAAAVFLLLFVSIGALDGAYYHLHKYKLQKRNESLYEHKLHTARAFLFIPIVYFLFFRNFAGLMLWTGILFVLIDTVVEVMDAACERASRASLGGLSSAEYVTHVLAITTRSAAIALILSSKPSSAWSLSASAVQPDYPAALRYISIGLMCTGAVGAAVHVRETYAA